MEQFEAQLAKEKLRTADTHTLSRAAPTQKS
jgi:hypothetical protein